MKRNWYTYFVMCQHIIDFSDQSKRHDNSSEHVQGSYGSYNSSKLQIDLINNWAGWYRPASHE